jgi:pyrroloquinoline quinone (PQQ) biosynthesis protein C
MERIMTDELMRRLRACGNRRELINHRFFRETVSDPGVGRDGAAIVLGQWWRPLHYFPVFLSRSIAILDDLRHQSFLADVLNEELGEGDPQLAHERIFIETMSDLGFSVEQLTQANALPATTALVESYTQGAESRLTALGCVFATEVADLAMVGGIGKLVRRVTGAAKLPWVDIHIQQEPNHVDKVHRTLGGDFTPDELEAVVSAADEHWAAWCAFFDALDQTVKRSAPALEPI